MTLSLPRTRGRRLPALTAALVLALSLTACGDDGEESDGDGDSSQSTEDAQSRTEDDLAPALLTTDDLPEGYTEVEPEDSEDDTFDGTCLEDIQDFDEALGAEPEVEAESEFDQEDQASQSTVNSKVAVYGDADAVAEALPPYLDTIAECGSVEATNDEGVTFALDITVDDAVTLDGVDQQARIEVAGTVTTAEGQSLPVTITLLAGFTGATLSATGVTQLGTPAEPASIDDLAAVQATRVQETLG